jgi:nitrite reductase/ring-hydroxylating ferredoxin subunit
MEVAMARLDYGMEMRDMSAEEIAPGSCKSGVIDGKQVTIFNLEGKLYATQAECTHRGGPLCEGAIWGEIVTCPWHGSEFNIRTGEVITGPADEPLETYDVSVEGGKIVLGVEGLGVKGLRD